MGSLKPITMPFTYETTYNKTDLTDVPVETYTDLLEAVEKAVFLFPKDTDIKEFCAWLKQLPAVDSDDEFSEGADNDEEEYPVPTYATLEDSRESQEGIIDVLGGFLEIYVIKKKLWVLTNKGLLLLCVDREEPRTVTVPLYDPNFDPYCLIGSLIPFYDIFHFVYRLDENLSLIMSAPDDDDVSQPRTVEFVINKSTAPDHVEFERSVKAGEGGTFTTPNFNLVVAMNNSAYFTSRVGGTVEHVL